jgi:hypothetical protein
VELSQRLRPGAPHLGRFSVQASGPQLAQSGSSVLIVRQAAVWRRFVGCGTVALVERPHGDPVVGPDLAAFVRSGVATVVATRDDDLGPEIARSWGPEVAADGASVTLCVPAPAGSKTLANLEGNGAITATFVVPTTYRAVQLKGTMLDMREPTPEQLAQVEEHIAAFIEQVEQIGVTRKQVRQLVEPEFVAVTFAVRELYDQTPGPSAGSRL